MTPRTAPAPSWVDHAPRRRRQIACGFLANLALVSACTWRLPETPWLGYWWALTVVTTVAAVWVWRTEQRRAAWGDRAVAFWCWHWFTGTPLVLVNNPSLPWWRDLRACWPYLDTSRAEPCPTVEIPDDPAHPLDVARARRHARLSRLWCQGRRIVTGTGRTAATAAVVSAEYVRSGAPFGRTWWVLAGWGIAGCVVLVLVGIAVAAVAVQMAMHRWWTRPLALALADVCGQPLTKRPTSWVKIGRRWQNGRRLQWWRPGHGRIVSTRERGIEIIVSPTYKAGNQRVREDTLAQAYTKAGLSPMDVDPVWNLKGSHRSLRLVPARTIPDAVRFTDDRVRSWALKRARPLAPVFGAGKGWAPAQWSLESDAPHAMVAGPTKSGKSVLTRALLFQLLWHSRLDAGTRAEIWDIKLKSHTMFESLLCVTYYRRLHDIAQRILAVADMADKRGAADVLAERQGLDSHFPPLFVVFEDVAQAITQMAAHPNNPVNPANPSGKTLRDALLAWDRILGLGRGVNIHVIACPHRPTAAALGGTVARDNFGLVVLMTGFAAGSLRLVDPTLRYEPLPDIKGRALVLHGPDATIIQSMWDDGDEMVNLLAEHYGTRPMDGQTDPTGAVDDWAIETGTVEIGQGPSFFGVAGSTGGENGRGAVATSGDSDHTGHHSEDGPDPVTLLEAYRRRIVGAEVEFESVKQARNRARRVIAEYESEDKAAADGWWFPPIVDTVRAPGGKRAERYSAEMLHRWWNSRIRTKPDDHEWWVYWVVEGGMAAVRYGGVVKIGFTDDLRQRMSSFGKHWPGADRVGGDIVHLERYTTRKMAMDREAQLHEVYKAARRVPLPGTDPMPPNGTTLAVWPKGRGGNGGRETFWIEGVLARDMARHCPSRADALAWEQMA